MPAIQPPRSRLVPKRTTRTVFRPSQKIVAPTSGTVTVYCGCICSDTVMVFPALSAYGSAGRSSSLKRFVRLPLNSARARLTSSMTSPVGNLIATPMASVT